MHLVIALFAIGAVVASTTSLSASETVLYNFRGAPDGAIPNSGVIDGGNAFYGSTLVGGSGPCPASKDYP